MKPVQRATWFKGQIWPPLEAKIESLFVCFVALRPKSTAMVNNNNSNSLYFQRVTHLAKKAYLP